MDLAIRLKFEQYIKDEHFDSDSINDDIYDDEISASNIINQVNDVVFGRVISQFIQLQNGMLLISYRLCLHSYHVYAYYK